jgi:ribosomal protein S18 acetylase RimI-like enzyme
LATFIAQYIPADGRQLQSRPSTTDGTQQSESSTYTIDIQTADSIPEPDFEACFALIEQTSSDDYTSSSVGWSPIKKRKEMRLPDMRYMLLRRQAPPTLLDGKRIPVLGFVSFMTTYEDGKEVLYCYEIHVDSSLQGQGLGGQLMGFLEEIGRRIGLEKVMLTVFKANGSAVRFYEKLGYHIDEFSPQPRTLRNGTVKEPDYLILSKRLRE